MQQRRPLRRKSCRTSERVLHFMHNWQKKIGTVEKYIVLRLSTILRRFAKNLTEAKSIAIRRGFYVGLSQALSNSALYAAYGLAFWFVVERRFIWNEIHSHRYGPQLVRTCVSSYAPGTVIIVCWVIIFFSSYFLRLIRYLCHVWWDFSVRLSLFSWPWCTALGCNEQSEFIRSKSSEFRWSIKLC